MRELEELVPQFETVMAEKERLAGRASALELDLKDARSKEQHSQASLRRAEEVQRRPPQHQSRPACCACLGCHAPHVPRVVACVALLHLKFTV